LTIGSGTVIVLYGVEGILLGNNAILTSTGTPLSPVHFTPFYAIQELATNWDGNVNLFATEKLLGFPYTNAPSQTASLRFTQFDSMSSGGFHIYAGSFWSLLSLTAQDCDFGPGTIYAASASGQTTCVFRNNLLEGASTDFEGDFSSLSLYNNLWKGGGAYFDKVGATNHFWTVKDNAFDNCNVGWDDDSFTTGNNAFIKSTQLQPTNASDIVLSTFTWQSGPLGAFYQNTNSLLINAGSRTADLASLFHFCTTTNEVKETNSLVDLSFHFVAVDASGNPIDADSDGIPDYLEDVNGNGVVNSGETDWQNAADWGLRVLITRPRNGSIIP
jgi:hypothetical protein